MVDVGIVSLFFQMIKLSSFLPIISLLKQFIKLFFFERLYFMIQVASRSSSRARVIIILFVGMLATFYGIIGSPSVAHASPASDVLSITNSDRAANGLAPFNTNAAINQVAYNWAVQMAQAQSMVHNPNYPSQIPAGWSSAGENIAYGQATAADVMTAWMNSPHHRENILGNYTTMGVGMYTDSNGVNWWVQDFGNYPAAAPAPAPVVAPPAPAPAPAPVTSPTTSNSTPANPSSSSTTQDPSSISHNTQNSLGTLFPSGSSSYYSGSSGSTSSPGFTGTSGSPTSSGSPSSNSSSSGGNSSSSPTASNSNSAQSQSAQNGGKSGNPTNSASADKTNNPTLNADGTLASQNSPVPVGLIILLAAATVIVTFLAIMLIIYRRNIDKARKAKISN